MLSRRNPGVLAPGRCFNLNSAVDLTAKKRSLRKIVMNGGHKLSLHPAGCHRASNWYHEEMPVEEAAGLGFGMTIPLGLKLFGGPDGSQPTWRNDPKPKLKNH